MKTLDTFILIGIVAVLIVALTPYAEAAYDSYKTCEAGTTCDFVIYTINASDTSRFINNTACNLSIFSHVDYGTRILNNASMLQPNATFGLFNYSYTFTTAGHYPAYVGCFGTDTAILSSGHSQFEIALVGLVVSDSVGDLVDVSVEVVNTTTNLNNTGLFLTTTSLGDWGTAVVLAMLIVIGLLSYYSIKLVQLNKYLRLLLFLAAFLLLIVTVNVATNITEYESASSTDVISLLDTTHMVLIWLFIAVFGVLFILFLFGVIDNIRKRKGDITP